jgi:hypothetical protein
VETENSLYRYAFILTRSRVELCVGRDRIDETVGVVVSESSAGMEWGAQA